MKGAGVKEAPVIGVAIAAHNARDLTRDCLEHLLASDYPALRIVVVDDGSTDGTWEMLRDEYPGVKAIRGDGNLWWSGATNLAVTACLEAGCDYILLLNPDVAVEPDTVTSLLRLSQEHGDAIVAAAVLRRDDPGAVHWAGIRWGRVKPFLPIHTGRYIIRPGTPADALPEQPFETAEVHGRGVLVPARVFAAVGLYDEKRLPQYGADVDFSFRAARAGFRLLAAPQIRVTVHAENTGNRRPGSFGEAVRGYWRFLVCRKNGEALRVWWVMLRRHVPWYAVLPSYLFIMALNTFRYWQRYLSGRW